MARLDYAYARSDMTNIPRGVGAPPPPGMNSTKRGRLVCIKVRMLDDTVAVFHLGHKAIGQTLLDEVCRHLNLLECDYFGLAFIDINGNHCWLDRDKTILRQITNGSTDAKFYFIVKFYTPNPIDLEEEYTRYLFTLQIKWDLALGELHCSDSTAALLAAYSVQSECGDFSADDYPDATYLSHSRFVPNQTLEFQKKVMDNHRNFIGMSPGESDLAMLEVARRCDFYSVKLHAAKDIDGNDAALSVMHLGIKVFRQLQLDTTFSWARIRKLSFKRKKLLVKLHPDSYQYLKETVEFVFDTRDECKNFWKKCVEHHAFFRCVQSEEPRKETRFFISKGSSFRYHGRTQKQLIDYVREHHKRREPFTRPLRSATTRKGGYSSSYGIVTERSSVKQNHNGSVYDDRSDPYKNRQQHSSMPHIAHYSSYQADPSFSEEPIYQQINKKKDVIIGINSTFSAETICTSEPMKIKSSKNKMRMTRSTTSELTRADSSDSGGVSLGEPSSSRGPDFSPIYKHSQSSIATSHSRDIEINLESENIEMLCLPTYRDDYFITRSDFAKQEAQLGNVIKEFYWKEVVFTKDLELIMQTFFETIKAHVLNCLYLKEMFGSLNELRPIQKTFMETLKEAVDEKEELMSSILSPVLLATVHNLIPIYNSLVSNYPFYISALDQLIISRPEFRAVITKFEASKECYIPINWLLMKILSRIINWQPVLARMIETQLSEGAPESEITSVRVAMDKINDYAKKSKTSRNQLEEYISLLQLEKDIGLVGKLSNPIRKVLRYGYVLRYARRAPCNRIMILCSDRILFGHRGMNLDGNFFTVHAELKLKGLMVEEGDTYKVMDNNENVITLHNADISIVISAPDRAAWIEDITEAIKEAARSKADLPSLVMEKKEECDIDLVKALIPEESPMSKLSPLQICWYRKCSFGKKDTYRMVTNTMCGYLKRKLRNSSGWQDLWVVLCCNTLFFYRNHQEKEPLAHLSLIDYGIGLPNVHDNINHENCFKLFYGSHHYFFKADSYYFFERWVDSIFQAAISHNSLDVVTALALHI